MLLVRILGGLLGRLLPRLRLLLGRSGVPAVPVPLRDHPGERVDPAAPRLRLRWRSQVHPGRLPPAHRARRVADLVLLDRALWRQQLVAQGGGTARRDHGDRLLGMPSNS